ncbi:MAG TPA: M23 family metallopeptidase, partial [Flavobacteriaceae bacterium]|nr:M23 family metallopeptidase [Flavobacteriaceae bacterium]
MAKKQSKRQKFKHKLIDKYRLIILNEDTYEEKLTFRLNRLNVFIIGGTFSILLVVGTIFLIAFTPVREYIPGYSSPKLKRTATDLVYKTDSLEQVIKLNNIYIDKIQQVLSGEVEKIEYDEDSILSAFEFDKDTMNLMPSEKDLEFRDEIEAIDRFSIFSEATKSTEIVFFAPVTGTITDTFNPDKKHFAVDLAVEMGTPVKSVADGTVIFAEWTATTGHLVIVKHAA